MQFGLMSGKASTDAAYVSRRIQEEYVQMNMYMRIVDFEQVFDRVTKKIVERAMRKKGIPETLVRAEMSLYIGAITKVKDRTY